MTDLSSLQSFRPSLIFFDVDGTLLNTQGKYSQTLKYQLKRLEAQGVKLAIASGRPKIAAQFLFDELPLTHAGLFCTGAELYDPKCEKHLDLHPIDTSVVEALLSAIRSLHLYCECYTPEFYAVDDTARNTDIALVHSEHLRVEPRFISSDQLLREQPSITKLLLGVEKTREQVLYNLRDQYSQVEFAFAHFLARPDWLFASVISQAADKHRGFDELLAYHQVTPDKVMAFGDSHSDIIFLQKAAVGLAMGNAVGEVKAVADMVTLSADDDGVAQALAQLPD